PLEQFVSALPLRPLAHTKILKYSTKLLVQCTEAKETTAKLEPTIKTQVGTKKNTQNHRILTVFKLAKKTSFEL
ncbi:hypothetical protein, partial [Vibrio parahaemolyticus]|uniref:hypothetical protein n=1 Tax=Vibrio parahaemolyticus TaxID=670 RepID=UPI001E3DFE95